MEKVVKSELDNKLEKFTRESEQVQDYIRNNVMMVHNGDKISEDDMKTLWYAQQMTMNLHDFCGNGIPSVVCSDMDKDKIEKFKDATKKEDRPNAYYVGTIDIYDISSPDKSESFPMLSIRQDKKLSEMKTDEARLDWKLKTMETPTTEEVKSEVSMRIQQRHAERQMF